MAADARRWLSSLVPPAVTQRAARRYLVRFQDGFTGWEAAAEAAEGYDAPQILAQVVAATRQVAAGQAAFERDGIAFSDKEFRWPVLASLLWQSSRVQGPLRVLDLGGSLGSLYRQHRRALNSIDLRWGVVEQPDYVAAGREFQDEQLHFFDSIQECLSTLRPNTLLMSSVLQYLPDLETVLGDCLNSQATMLILDRTPVVPGPTDLFAIQRVPASIYRASYPARLIGRDHLARLLGSWELVAEFPGLEPAMRTASGKAIDWIGMTLVRDLP